MREILDALLTREGYRVRLAATAEEGLELARTMPFDAAIVDVMLPGMDGITALDELKKINDAFLGLVKEAVAEENEARSTREGPITADPQLIGDRPCGETPMSAPIIQTASAVVKAFGLTPSYGISSTDSNVPMNLGVPAITIGRGGPGGRAHAPDEWTDVERKGSVEAIRIATAMILAVANIGTPSTP